MTDGFSLLTLAHHQRPSFHNNFSLRHATLRRKSAHLWDTAHGATSGYPSPPMSSPPSPSRRPSDLTLPSTRGEQFLPVSTNPPLTYSTPVHSLQQTTSPSASFGLANSDVPAYHPPATFATGLGSAVTFGSASGQFATTQYAPPPPISHQRTTSHDARKAKTHVASACVNCKRAHLSCDVQRPCARCVASGKQDTCYDVAHKKRGRPRLRDEAQFSSERSLPAANAPTSTTAQLTTPTRPIAATRQRRAESFRSIQSMTSEESSSYGPPTPSFLPRPPAPFQTPLTYQPPAHLVMSPQIEPEVPTALVDLDFVIIRANQSFRQIMADDSDLTRSRLHEIAAPADAESFMSIRSRLRGEREAREPSFLPPIVSSGEDPLAGVANSDVESFTRGFSDHTYTWVQLKPGSRSPQTFPARVRLAKAATYFAVITLPSFRPMEPAPPPPQPQPQAPSPYSFGPPLPPSEEAMREHHRQNLVHSAPPSFYYPVEMAHPQPRYLHRRAPSFSRTYPPPQIHYPPTFPQPQIQQSHAQQQQQQQQPHHFLPTQPTIASILDPRRPPTTDHPSTMPSLYIPTPTTIMPAPASSVPRETTHLPPISSSSALAPTTGPSSMPPIHEPPSTAIATAGVQRSSESGEDSEERRLRSPRKRRRMGIDEVLQK